MSSRYLVRRLLQAVPLLLGVTIAVFIVVQVLPGGPLAAYESDPTLTSADIANLREHFGMNEAIPLRYVKWLGAVLQGDLGYSLITHQPVAAAIADRLPNTLLLQGIAFLVTLAIALPVGMLSALRQYSWLDHLATLFAFAGHAVPTFWSGLLVIIVFAVELKQFGLPALPASGMTTLGAAGSLGDRVAHLVLPVAVIAFFNAAHYTRYVRASMLDVLHDDYIQTARAKGLAKRTVVIRHALRNAALPVITIIALDFPALFSGTVVVESIFAWPGMGRLFLDSAQRFDYAIVMGVVTISATLVILSTLVADIVYGLVDPRVHLT
jgi:peptide/nickel transport system permease protein